jgi:hypothetical protein
MKFWTQIPFKCRFVFFWWCCVHFHTFIQFYIIHMLEGITLRANFPRRALTSVVIQSSHQKCPDSGNWLFWRKTEERGILYLLTHLKSLPSNLRELVKRTVRAGILRPIAKVSVANSACNINISHNVSFITPPSVMLVC